MDEEDGFFKEEICTLTPDELFDAFLQSCDLAETLDVFRKLCQSVDVNPRNHKTLYASLKSKLTSWKCKSLWTKLDKRAEHKDYKNKPCVKNKVLVIGAGPCGLRVAIEAALLGAYVVVIEKRDRFSRNNVLHLWPFLIVDLKNLGAKKFFGQFCAGAIDHISIRRLQLILLKVSLILGVQVYPKCGFIKLVEPTDAHGWRGSFDPPSHTLNKFDFDIIVGADGRRAALKGFKGKEFRGKLAIGITVNFQNRNTKEEARVEEISGVAFIFNQQFFQDLKDNTGIDLENIVYYKDETHYFVMCAKKKSLLQKGVLKKDFQDAYDLLQTNNVNHDKLLAYAREAANFSTNNQLPNLDFALNHYHKEDVAMFDFTSLYHSEHAAKIYERRGRRLLATVVGDSLLEPFWPTGSGCARGFLGCFDAAWIMKGWGQGREPLDLLAERDSIFRLLAQTTPENISKNYEEFSINPATRYPNLNKSSVSQNRVKHLFDNKPGPIDQDDGPEPMDTSKDVSSVEGGVNARMLLKWCQEQTRKYKNVKINDMSTSWRSGLGFCAIIHRYRPDLIDYASLSPKDHLTNLQLAFDVAEEHLGIPPQMSASEMVMKDVPDTLMIVSYVSQYHEVFKNETPVAAEGKKLAPEQHEFRAKSPLSKLSVLTRVSRRTHKEKRRSEEALDIVPKRKRPAVSKENEENVVPMDTSPPCKVSSQGPAVTTGKASNRISALAQQVFGPGVGNKSNVPSVRDSSEMCFFCKRRVYLMERLSAEGHFFHRECFLCENCGCTLRLGSYSYIPPTSPGEKGHFLCHLHYDQLLYKMQEEPVDEGQVPGKGRPRLTKSKSAAPNTLFKNVEVTIQPDDREAVSFEPKPECDNAKINGFHDDQEILGREDNDGSRVKHERSNSFGKYKRLEARPLRRSSIASVRKSDKTVRDKGVGYTFSDGLVDDRDAKRDGRPLQMPSRNGTRKAVEFERPSTPGSSTGTPVKEVTVDINMEEPLADERKKKREEERKSVIDAVKTAAAGKSWLKKQDAQEGMVQKLGTLERRKAKSRRAMYPPLSTYFNPEDKETQDALEGISQITRGQQHMHVKMVDISLEDDNPSSTGNKAADQGKTRPKTVSIATANEPTSPPRPSTSPTSPTSPSYYKPGKVPGRSLVAARAARLTNLIANDFRPLPVKDKREEKEERKNVSAAKSEPSDKNAREEQAAPAGSPSAQRRSLPRVPAEEPFHSTKETTKIVQQKQKGRKGFHFGKGKKQDKKTDKEAEDMGFVVLDLNDGLSTPEKEAIRKQEEEELFSESSEDDLLDENSPKLQRSNARRFGKPRRNTESPDDKLKKREQAKIRSAMKQRESKRLRMAQSIQRELEETAVKQADLEREGVVVEKALRSGGDTGAEEQQLMLQWFKLVNRKNALIRYESELVIHANSIQLEDQQGRLEGEIRELLMKEHPSKQDNRIVQQKTKQLVDIVEQRNQLVELLEEERKREQEEDRLFDSILAAKALYKRRTSSRISFITTV